MICPECDMEMKEVLKLIPLVHLPGVKPQTLKKKNRTKRIYYCRDCDEYYNPTMRLEKCQPVQ